MKNFRFFIFSILLISNFNIKSVDWLITTSGNYKLGYDINSTGDANGTIRIQSSYVNLDLNGFFLRQTTSTSGCIGIVIDPACNNINIKNGTVTGFQATGISVGANCSKITIKDMLVEFCTASGTSGAGIAVGAGCNNLLLDNILTVSCTVDGIDFNGASDNNIVDSVIRNCCVIGCSTDAANGILLINCARIKVVNAILNSNGNSLNNFTGINIESSPSCTFENIDMKNNVATNFTGFFLSSSSQLILGNCVIDSCSASAALFVGCDIMSCNNILIKQLSVLNCYGDGSAVFVGILASAANSIKLSDIIIEGNVNGWNIFHNLNGTSISNSILDNFKFINNSATNLECILLAPPFNYNTISNFIFSGNSFTSGTATGINFSVSGGPTNYLNNNISNGIIENNSTNAGSFVGISLDPYMIGNYFSNIIIQGNSSAASGFQGISQTSNSASSNNYFYDCKVLNNSCASNASITNPAAFLFSTPVNLQLVRCVAANNRCSGAVCYGLNLSTTGSSAGNVVRDCEFYENNGNTDANSYGVFCGDSASTLFINNVSYKNGPTNPLIANQLFGLPIGSTTTPGGGGAGRASSRIASATAPWTNLQITN